MGGSQNFPNDAFATAGRHNISTSYLLQRNDTIMGSQYTGYTIKLSGTQCLTVSGFDSGNNTCVVDPSRCTGGLTATLWVKFQASDLLLTSNQILLSAGSLAGQGYNGWYIYQTKQTVGVRLSDGESTWSLQLSFAGLASANQWFNVAFRWSADIGLQMFLNGVLADENKSPTLTEQAEFPRSNVMYIGCRERAGRLADYTAAEIDEVALWRSWLVDWSLVDLTGSIITPTSSGVFMYGIETEIIPAEAPADYSCNPYYTTATWYATCTNDSFWGNALVLTERKTYGVNLTALTKTVPNTAVTNLTLLPDGVAASVWVLASAGRTTNLMTTCTWSMQLNNTALYVRVTYVNSTSGERVTIESTATPLSARWINVAFSFHPTFGLRIYVDGSPVATSFVVVPTTSATLSCSGITFTGTDEVVISDMAVWNRFLFPFESYRFMGWNPSALQMSKTMDYYWAYDYFMINDLKAIGTWRPIYTLFNSSSSFFAGVRGPQDVDQAIRVNGTNGWLMLGAYSKAEDDPTVGSEFQGTCLGDPSLCSNGLTVGMWVKLLESYSDASRHVLITSGAEDSDSRGFCLSWFAGSIVAEVASTTSYWSAALSTSESSSLLNQFTHLAISWSVDDGLCLYVNGIQSACQSTGSPISRTGNRYSRITLGRNNGDNFFHSYSIFQVHDVAIRTSATPAYDIRSLFNLPESPYYADADYYWSKEQLVSSKLTILISSTGSASPGPRGGGLEPVRAFNNTISLVSGSYIGLGNFSTASSCIGSPQSCSTSGFSASSWVRFNVLENVTCDIIVLSSNELNSEVIMYNQSKTGYVLFARDRSFGVVVVTTGGVWRADLSPAAKKLSSNRWYNLGFAWSLNSGITLFVDGQIAGIQRAPTASASPSVATDTWALPTVGSTLNAGCANFDVYNLAMWKRYIYSSQAYQLTGHDATDAQDYASSDLVWKFHGPIYKTNRLFDQMQIDAFTTDSSGKGRAIKLRVDGQLHANLGNYTGVCVTQPSMCDAGFLLKMKVNLKPFTPASLPPDDVGSLLLLGSPDAGFEGLAIQLINVGGKTAISVQVANNAFLWTYAYNLTKSDFGWHDLVVGWNTKDGIEMKMDMIKVNGKSKVNRFSTAKLMTNYLLTGITSSGSVTQLVDADIGDIIIQYNSKAAVDNGPRCTTSPSAAVKQYYRLNEGQIFTMFNVLYEPDRFGLQGGAFRLKNGSVELEDFAGQCFSDPSLCSDGLTVSFYVKLPTALLSSAVLLSSGYPTESGFSIEVSPVAGQGTKLMSLAATINDGNQTWTTSSFVPVGRWISVGLIWQRLVGQLTLYLDGIANATTSVAIVDAKTKATCTAIALGKDSCAGLGQPRSAILDAAFDDVSLWDWALADSLRLNSILPLDLQACTIKETTTPPVNILAFSTASAGGRSCVYQFSAGSYNVCASDLVDLSSQLDRAGPSAVSVPMLVSTADNLRQQFERLSANSSLKDFNAATSVFQYFTSQSSLASNLVASDATNILQVGADLMSQLLKPELKTSWHTMNKNESAASTLMQSFETFGMAVISQTELGFDIADDCTKMCASSDGVKVNGEKRRLWLCQEPYVFPSCSQTSDKAAANKTSDSIAFPVNMWPLSDYLEDQTVSIVVTISDSLPTVMPLITGSAEATTSLGAKLIGNISIISRVISVVVDPPVPKSINGCITIALEHLDGAIAQTDGETVNSTTINHCAFWDFSVSGTLGGAWNDDGCTVAETNDSHTVCCCTHLTSFVIIRETIEPNKTEPVPPDYTIYIAFGGCGLSIGSLLLLCIIIVCNRNANKVRKVVHLTIAMATMIACAFFLAGYAFDYDTTNKALCKAISICQHLFFTVAYSWMFADVAVLFSEARGKEVVGHLKVYIPLLWIVAGFIVGGTAGVTVNSYGSSPMCWLASSNLAVLTMIGPIAGFLFLSTIVLLLVACNLPPPRGKWKEIHDNAKTAAASLFVAVLLFGATWSLAAVVTLFPEVVSVEIQYAFVASFSLQGFFVFLFYGFGYRQFSGVSCACERRFGSAKIGSNRTTPSIDSRVSLATSAGGDVSRTSLSTGSSSGSSSGGSVISRSAASPDGGEAIEATDKQRLFFPVKSAASKGRRSRPRTGRSGSRPPSRTAAAVVAKQKAKAAASAVAVAQPKGSSSAAGAR